MAKGVCRSEAQAGGTPTHPGTAQAGSWQQVNPGIPEQAVVRGGSRQQAIGNPGRPRNLQAQWKRMRQAESGSMAAGVCAGMRVPKRKVACRHPGTQAEAAVVQAETRKIHI